MTKRSQPADVLALRSVKRHLEEGNLLNAEGALLDVLFNRNLALNWQQGEFTAPKILNYVNNIKFDEGTLTASVEYLYTKIVRLGPKFFTHYINSLGDLLAILYHERNHLLIRTLLYPAIDSKPEAPRTTLGSTLPHNVIDDILDNAIIRQMVYSDIFERFYIDDGGQLPWVQDSAGPNWWIPLLTCRTSKVAEALNNLNTHMEQVAGVNQQLTQALNRLEALHFGIYQAARMKLAVDKYSKDDLVQKIHAWTNEPLVPIGIEGACSPSDLTKIANEFGCERYATNLAMLRYLFAQILEHIQEHKNEESPTEEDPTSSRKGSSGSKQKAKGEKSEKGSAKATENSPSNSGSYFDPPKEDAPLIGGQPNEKNPPEPAGPPPEIDEPTGLVRDWNDVTNDETTEVTLEEETGGCSSHKVKLKKGTITLESEISADIRRVLEEQLNSPEWLQQREAGDFLNQLRQTQKNSTLRFAPQMATLAGELIALHHTDDYEDSCQPNLPARLSKGDLYTMAQGYTPALYTTRTFRDSDKHKVYVDVSGSMVKYVTLVPEFMRAIESIVDGYFQFSDYVIPMPFDFNYRDIITSSGTLFQQVALHIIRNGYRKVVIMTDNEGYIELDTYARLKELTSTGQLDLTLVLTLNRALPSEIPQNVTKGWLGLEARKVILFSRVEGK